MSEELAWKISVHLASMEQKPTPPSPAPSIPDGLPSSFNELIQHSTLTSYPREQFPVDMDQLHSRPVSRYGTPLPQSAVQYESPMAYQGIPFVRETGSRCAKGRYSHTQQAPSQQSMYPQPNSDYGPLPDEIHAVSLSLSETRSTLTQATSSLSTPTHLQHLRPRRHVLRML